MKDKIMQNRRRQREYTLKLNLKHANTENRLYRLTAGECGGDNKMSAPLRARSHRVNEGRRFYRTVTSAVITFHKSWQKWFLPCHKQVETSLIKL